MKYKWKTLICKSNSDILDTLENTIVFYVLRDLDKEVIKLTEDNQNLTNSIESLKEQYKNELIQSKEEILDIKIKYLELLNTVKHNIDNRFKNLI